MPNHVEILTVNPDPWVSRSDGAPAVQDAGDPAHRDLQSEFGFE